MTFDFMKRGQTRKKYNESGQLIEEFPPVKDGKWNGPYREYYDNGQLKEERTYEDDKWQGPYKSYYPNGQLKAKGTRREDGSWEDDYEEYGENGVRKLLSPYKETEKNSALRKTLSKGSNNGIPTTKGRESR